MGLLNKTFDLAKKATGTVLDTAGKKINEAKAAGRNRVVIREQKKIEKI